MGLRFGDPARRAGAMVALSMAPLPLAIQVRLAGCYVGASTVKSIIGYYPKGSMYCAHFYRTLGLVWVPKTMVLDYIPCSCTRDRRGIVGIVLFFIPILILKFADSFQFGTLETLPASKALEVRPMNPTV